MKSIKIMGLCLVAVFALSAVVTSSAFAEKPEFLFPGGGTKRQFSAVQSSAEGILETRKGETVRCTGGTATGEISGAKQASSILITYTGCTATVGLEEFNCQSGATTGEINTFALLGRIGFDVKPKVGILFNPETGKINNPKNLFAEFECTNKKTGGKNINIKVKGSVIALLTPTNTLIEPGGTNTFFEIIFKKSAEKGIPEDRKLEGETGNNQLLTLTTFTTKEKVKETGGEEGWIESATQGVAKAFPLESMKICTE